MNLNNYNNILFTNRYSATRYMGTTSQTWMGQKVKYLYSVLPFNGRAMPVLIYLTPITIIKAKEKHMSNDDSDFGSLTNAYLIF